MSAVREERVAKIQTTYVKQQENTEAASVRKRKLLKRRLSCFLIFAAIISYLMISSFVSQTSSLDSKIVQKKQLNEQLKDLKMKQATLKEDIAKLNDDDYIAKLARKEYFFSDKNEIIFNIPESKKEKSTNH